ncbi:MAG: hypothetical protein OXC30_05300 [Alphaproteobacteria bacterium]|nr:hypothetical protein [Alphaproteobacteria bacterium]
MKYLFLILCPVILFGAMKVEPSCSEVEDLCNDYARALTLQSSKDQISDFMSADSLTQRDMFQKKIDLIISILPRINPPKISQLASYGRLCNFSQDAEQSACSSHESKGDVVPLELLQNLAREIKGRTNWKPTEVFQVLRSEVDLMILFLKKMYKIQGADYIDVIDSDPYCVWKKTNNDFVSVPKDELNAEEKFSVSILVKTGGQEYAFLGVAVMPCKHCSAIDDKYFKILSKFESQLKDLCIYEKILLCCKIGSMLSYFHEDPMLVQKWDERLDSNRAVFKRYGGAIWTITTPKETRPLCTIAK